MAFCAGSGVSRAEKGGGGVLMGYAGICAENVSHGRSGLSGMYAERLYAHRRPRVIEISMCLDVHFEHTDGVSGVN